MSDLKNLSRQRRVILQIKIDGHIEAAIFAAKANGIGLSEAISLTSRALVKEMAANSMDRDKVHRFLSSALRSVFAECEERSPRYKN
ncbi:hypothetical protein [Ruegeria atlantica]|uniref:Uncharacterized protein n=1 Tax=Ruegeria atlantica TaxID=81569 RepID=A0A0P1EWB7_9RHOB|nr:hypothetical protein [Ruegeria atlantica]CUH46410.1 hypothetical protein RUA4292_00576 [Ruegeria atlantica]